MADIKMFPGTEKVEDVSVEAVLKDVAERNLKEIVVIGVGQDDAIFLTGNSTLTKGVFLMEVGKTIIIENS